jgi:hypothetical protein
MKRIMLSTITVLFFTVFFTANVVGTTPAMQNDMKKVVVVYSEKNVAIEGKDIFLSYYDEATLAWINIKDKTDATGTITFLVPGTSTGASCIFTFALTEANIRKSFEMRIPAETVFGGQDSISLKIGKGKKFYYIENSGAPMQWMPTPIEGLKVEENLSNINILKYNWGTQEASDIKRMSFANGGTKPVGTGDIFLAGSVINIILK